MMRAKITLICLVCFVLISTIYLFTFSLKDAVPSYSNYQYDLQNMSYLNATISRRNNILFLKTHKCASSTVQNILMRFGLNYSLDFVLPATRNYIGNPLIFQPDMIVNNLKSPSRKFNIFAHHTRYNYKNINSVMYPDTIYVTILRNPATQFESVFHFYKLNKTRHINFDDLLENPKNSEKFLRTGSRKFGLNQMCWDLGMDEIFFNNETLVKNFVEKIDREFDLVMIMEYLDVSLILLADIMNWPLNYVTYLNLNSRVSKRELTLEDEKKLTDLNYCDKMLHEHFLKKFQLLIKNYGYARMEENVRKLLKMNHHLEQKCVLEKTNKGYAKTLSYIVHNDLDWDCIYSAKQELKFTEEIRQVQLRRFNVIGKLQKFMNTSYEL